MKARELSEGDLLLCHDGSSSVVESVNMTERNDHVYNLRVEADHTFFVGDESWGFSVWGHNTYKATKLADGKVELVDDVTGKRTVFENESDFLQFFSTTSGSKIPFQSIDDAVSYLNTPRGKLPPGLRDYVRDVETRTGVLLNEKQIAHLKDALRKKDFKHVTPKEVTQNRRDFDAMKDELIAEWERQTGQKWPRYSENVPKKNGKPGFSRLKGDPYDAHHLIENELDGPAVWWNIHPARFPDQHQGGIHGSGSPLRKLLKNID